ncbi:MAG: hypothetical protein OEY05_00840 [Paracoccaceae bacterium]|nr:hypothetical protein [Paracoccaceae bacterium]MDH5528555.1 hypothetical protein [Paracoccaceae bacterium]
MAKRSAVKMAERIGRFWRALPEWLRWAALAAAFMVGFEFLGHLPMTGAGLIPSAILLSIVSLTGFAVAARSFAAETSPADIVAQSEIEDDGRFPRLKLMLSILLLGVTAVVVWAIAETASRFSDLPVPDIFLAISTYLLAGLAGPFLLGPVLWLVGHMLPPVAINVGYLLRIAGPVADPMTARAAIDSVQVYAKGLGRAKRIKDADLRQYQLRPVGLTEWLTQMGQTVTVERLTAGRDLVLTSLTRGGDWEKTAYVMVGTDKEAVSDTVICESAARLASPFMRGFVRLVGIANLAQGAAEVEAMRFSRLTGVPVSVTDYRMIED